MRKGRANIRLNQTANHSGLQSWQLPDHLEALKPSTMQTHSVRISSGGTPASEVFKLSNVLPRHATVREFISTDGTKTTK
jgi:hypothetical protein